MDGICSMHFVTGKRSFGSKQYQNEKGLLCMKYYQVPLRTNALLAGKIVAT